MGQGESKGSESQFVSRNRYGTLGVVRVPLEERSLLAPLSSRVHKSPPRTFPSRRAMPGQRVATLAWLCPDVHCRPVIIWIHWTSSWPGLTTNLTSASILYIYTYVFSNHPFIMPLYHGYCVLRTYIIFC